MRRVLLISFYFPPAGGGGVQRSIKFVKYLREFGYEPVVLTISEAACRALHCGSDDSLASDVPDDLEVVRTELGDRWRVRERLHRVRLLGPAAFFLYPWFWELHAAWYRPALRAARARLARRDIDLVFCTCGPYTAARVAARTAREFGLPWIVDMRDGFTLGQWPFPSVLHRRLARRLEGRLLSRANRVIFVGEEMRRTYLNTFPSLEPDRTAVVDNGYDPDDFAAPLLGRTDDKLRLAYVGTLRAVPPPMSHEPRVKRINPFRRLLCTGEDLVDRGPVDATALLQGLREAGRQRPGLFEDMDLRFYGQVNDPERFDATVAALGLGQVVRRLGPVPHTDAVAAMRAADVLVHLAARRRGRARNYVIGGKTYEYMAARRPILAIGGPSEGIDYCVRSGLGRACEPEPAAIARALLGYHDAWRAGRLHAEPDEAFLGRFTRRRLTEQLGHVFDQALAESGPHTGPRVTVLQEGAGPRLLTTVQQALTAAGARARPLRHPRNDRLLFWLGALACRPADAFYALGVQEWPNRFRAARLLGRRTVLHWIGTDVYHMQTDPARRERFRRAVLPHVDRHWAVSDRLAAELHQALGVRASVVPIVDHTLTQVPEAPPPRAPAVFTYGTHVGLEHDDFYGIGAFCDLAARFSHVPFRVLVSPPPAHRELPPNVEFLGFIQDMPSVYRDHSVYVRLTRHDGLPKMVLESLAWGRQVVYSGPFPHCLRARNMQEAVDVFARLLEQGVSYNRAGREFVRRTYAPSAVGAAWCEALSAL